MYHQILHDTKKRGIEVGDVKLNLKQMMAAKDTSVDGLTKGVEFLFKKNKVDYIRGTAALSGEHEVQINQIDGGETALRARNILIATGSEATPFPGLTIDEKRVITSTGAIALDKVPKKMVVIGGGIIGLEMVGYSINKTLSCYRLTYFVGLRMVKIRSRRYSRRISRPDRRTRHGCGDLQNDAKNSRETRHEVHAQYQSSTG